MSEPRRSRVWRPEESERQYAEARIERADPWNRRTLRSFARWLSGTRGLAWSTIAKQIHPASTFVDAVTRRLGRSCISALRALDIDTVEGFFVEYGKGRGMSSRRSMQSAMRSLLRFAAERGWVGEEMVSAVPSLVSYRLSGLPRGLSDDQLARLLERPFRRGGCRRRDWAIVCLLASYGARRGQVSALQLGDVDWGERTIELAAHKGGKAVRHALIPAVAEALAAYLREERPESPGRSVFLRHRRPHEQLSPGAITTMVRLRMVDRGLPPFGPHALRHTFATRLLRAGEPVKTIADLLGHRSLASVGIYAKADVGRLLGVAGEWPEVGS
jgi:integrase/recombinase XerD